MIPALAFNNLNANLTSEINMIGDHLERFTPKLSAFSSPHKRYEFRSKTSAVTINGLVINALSHNGFYLEREHPENLEIVIPFDGFIKAFIGGVHFELSAGSNALLKVSDGHKSNSEGSNIVIRLDKKKFDATFLSILAKNRKSPKLDHSRSLPMQFKNVSFFTLFKILMNQIDNAACNPDLLQKLAFDDRVYRLAVGLTYPESLLSDEPISGRRPQVGSEIDSLCEYLRENLTRPAALTEMERMSGLSARQLQYAFRKKLGMNAKTWLRKQRLHLARRTLLDTHEHTSVEFVAYELCFGSSLEFAQYYLEEFGELPSETVAKKAR